MNKSKINIKISKQKLSQLRDFQTSFIEELAKSKNTQKLYLQTALEDYEKDKDLAAFLLALRTIAIAKGGISILAQKTKLNRQSIYKALSANGNPTFSTLDLILNSLGLSFVIRATA